MRALHHLLYRFLQLGLIQLIVALAGLVAGCGGSDDTEPPPEPGPPAEEPMPTPGPVACPSNPRSCL